MAPFFNEFVVRCQNGVTAERVQQACTEASIIGGYSLSTVYPEYKDCILFCCTETNTREEIDQLVKVLAEA